MEVGEARRLEALALVYLQLSAYQLALAEMGTPVDVTAIVMLPKNGDPAALYPSPLDATADGFLGALALWRALHAE